MATFTCSLGLRSLGARYDDGHEIGSHAHGWGQLVYASSGAIHVTAAGQAWLIPSARAVWLPPGTPHQLRMRGPTRLRTLYIPPIHCAALAPGPIGIMVSPLLRALIEELVRIGYVDGTDRLHGLMGETMLALLARAERLPLSLSLPTDARALRVARRLLNDPAGAGTLDDLAANCGASLRTVQRRFLDQTGMSLSQWRQVARLMAAACVLLDGRSVTESALEAGYSSLSAFIHAFHGKVGQTPSAFRRAAGF